MDGRKTEEFTAKQGTSWDIALSRPVSGTVPLVVSFRDSLGYDCGVEAFSNITDPRLITVRSKSGLILVGTIVVTYLPRVLAARPRKSAIRPVHHRAAS